MSKLSKEELLEWQKKWTDFYKPHVCNEELAYWLPKDEQAYQQIKELIQTSRVTEKWIEAKAGEMIVVILHGMKKDAIAFIRTLLKEAK